MANEILDPDLADYNQSLSELVVNSKPHILMLTMLAEDCKDTKAREIAAIIEQRILQGPIQHKMPALYLIDSICKNMINSSYVKLFEKSIVKLFTVSFLKADEKTKILMFKLRQTWGELFSNETMHALDTSIRKMDPNWPIVPLKAKQQQQQNSLENGREKNIIVEPLPLVQQSQASHRPQQQPQAQKQSGQFHRVVLPPGASVESKEVVKNSVNNVMPISRKNSDPRRERTQVEGGQEIFSRKIADGTVDSSRNITGVREHALIRATQLVQSNKSNNINNNTASSQLEPTKPQSPRKQPASIVVGANTNASQNKKHTLTSFDFFSTTNNSVSSSSLNNLGKIKKKKKNKNKSDFIEAGTDELQRSKQFDKKPDSFKKNNKVKSELGVSAAMKRKHFVSNSESVQPKQPRKASLHSEVISLPVAPDDVIPLGKKLGNAGPNWKPPLRSQATAASLKSTNATRSSSPPQPFNPTRKRTLSPNSRKADLNKNVPVAKTNIPSPNVFAKPEAVFNFPATNRPTQPASSSSGFGSGDVDYRFIPTTSGASVDVKVPINQEMLAIEGNHQIYEINKLGAPIIAPPVIPAGMPIATPVTAMPPQPPAPVGPLIEPDSMVLFINDKAHRLFYIDHVTAVVLRNVHPDRAFESLLDAEPYQLDPRRVYFQGQPTTVYIDRGQPFEQTFRLDFNALQPITFYLPSSPVPQTMMLGLPGRELVVNGRTFNIQFGNREPFRIYFDNDNLFHTFHLSDSKPSLQFSDDMRPDLWFQLLKEARMKSGHIAPHTNTGYNSFEPPAVPFPSQAHQPPGYAPQPPVTFSSYSPAVTAPMPSQTYDHTLVPSEATSTTADSVIPDIDNLLSKLTQAGLISVTSSLNSANVSSTTTTTTADSSKADQPKNVKQPKRDEKKAKQALPRQYLPLDIKKLQEPHDFVIDQLYTGSRCTNCSLRFNDDESLGNGKKTSYARHLDWHFRQNRRERGKPDGNSSSSTPVSHRQPYYYSLNLWILFKEVNDNVEEESEEDKTNNITNSLLTSNVDNLDFAKYRENISDFDGFLDSISDNNATTSVEESSTKKVCTVTAEADTKLNCCAVCNEKFEVKWEEDDEEWHCLNALRFKNLDEDQGSSVVSQIYHPLCLKDYLMQQL